jgi:hypothetical protein
MMIVKVTILKYMIQNMIQQNQKIRRKRVGLSQ